MPDSSLILVQLAEEFSARVRRGEMPGVEEYAAQNPELAERIRALFPTLLILEGLAGGAPAPAVPPPGLEPGSVFGPYRLGPELGRGGMGVVYEAVHLALQRRVALKVLLLHTAQGTPQLERFLREARTAAGLHHTNIIPVFDVGQVAGTPFYAMQLIQGRSLDRLAVENQPTAPFTPETPQVVPAPPIAPGLPAQEVARIGIQAAEALAYAHQRGVIHRDIKPSNLLLDDQGVLWITDFGLARNLDDVALTRSGQVLGTPRYMSPEQAQATVQPVDHRTDIYSLGATLYELLTRRPAFDGKTAQEVVLQIIDRAPVPPRRLVPSIPRDLETIVLKTLAKRPEDRYATAQDLADDLRRFTNGEPIHARRIWLPGRMVRWCRRNPVLAGVTAAALAVIVTLTSLYTWSLMQENARTRSALQTAQEREEESRQRLVRHYVSNGVRRMDEGDLLGSLPWFAEALRLDEDNPEHARMHRCRLTAVLQHCPRLQQMWFHDGPVLQVAFSGDGRRVLTGSSDGTARVWDAVTGEVVSPVLRHNDAVRRASLTPDGRRVLVVAGPERDFDSCTVYLWDADTGRALLAPVKLASPQPGRGYGVRPAAATLSADGKRVLLAGCFAAKEEEPKCWQVRCLDAATGRDVGPRFAREQPFTSVLASPDGRCLALGPHDGPASPTLLLDADTGNARALPQGAVAAGFSADGRRLLVAGNEDGSLKWLRTRDPKTLGPSGPAIPVKEQLREESRVVLSPDGRFVFLPRNWQVWDLGTAPPARLRLEMPADDPGQLIHAAFSPDGKQLSFLTWNLRAPYDALSSETRLWTWSVVEQGRARSADEWGQERRPVPLPVAGVSPDGLHLLTVPGLEKLLEKERWLTGPSLLVRGVRVEQQTAAQLWNPKTGKPASPPLRHAGPVSCLAFAPDGTRLLTGSTDGIVRLWDLAAGQPSIPSEEDAEERVAGWKLLAGRRLRAGRGLRQRRRPEGVQPRWPSARPVPLESWGIRHGTGVREGPAPRCAPGSG